MRILRKLLIGGLTVTLVVACVVGTACLVKRQVYVAICDAFPVAIDGSSGATVDLDFDVPVEPSGNAFIASQSEPVDVDPATTRAQARRAIEEGLCEASPEDREIWLRELQGESPEAIREILSLHRRLSPPQTLAGGGRLRENERVHLLSAEAPPPLFQPAGIVPPVRGSEDAICLLESSIKAMQSAEHVILNNIANAQTIGFKRSRVLFGDETYRQVALPGQIDQEGHPTTSGIGLGAGVRILANQVDVSQGRLRNTQQALDLGIQGEGYFQIQDGDHVLYTRTGAFAVNANGEIVLASKDRARPLEPAITIPCGTVKIMISPDGIVSVQAAGQTQMDQFGQIQLARFMNSQGLVARGENLFEATTATGHPIISPPRRDSMGEIRQGALEESNVAVADELAELHRMQEQLKTLQQLHSELGGSGVER